MLISSPYVSSAGSERLTRIYQAMVNKGSVVSIITYPSSHYSDDIKDRIGKIHNKLMMAGIRTKFANRIPSKYAVIDKEVIWYGSMNLVSNIKEEDDEMRLINRSVAKALIEEQTIDISD